MEYIFFLFLFHFVPIRDKEERSRSKSAIARPVRTCNEALSLDVEIFPWRGRLLHVTYLLTCLHVIVRFNHVSNRTKRLLHEYDKWNCNLSSRNNNDSNVLPLSFAFYLFIYDFFFIVIFSITLSFSNWIAILTKRLAPIWTTLCNYDMLKTIIQRNLEFIANESNVILSLYFYIISRLN